MRTFSALFVSVLMTVSLAACGANGASAPASASKAGGTQASGSAAGAGTGSANSTAATKPGEAVSFAGKTVTLVSGFAAGGPTDLFDRLLARYLPKYLPGSPTVIVQDVTGAGGEVALNNLYNSAKPDGLTMGATTDPETAWALHDEGVKYEADKFQWAGGVPEGSIEYSKLSSGIKSAADFKGFTGSLTFGGLSPASNKDLYVETFLKALGITYKYVTGYSGVATINQAMRSGEITFADASLTDYNSGVTPMVKEGLAATISQTGMLDTSGNIVPDTRSNLPLMVDVVKQTTGKDLDPTTLQQMKVLAASHNALRALILPPKTSAAIVATWRKALADTFADQAFQDDAKKQFGLDMKFLTGDQAQQITSNVATVLNQNPDVLKRLQQMADVKPTK